MRSKSLVLLGNNCAEKFRVIFCSWVFSDFDVFQRSGLLEKWCPHWHGTSPELWSMPFPQGSPWERFLDASRATWGWWCHFLSLEEGRGAREQAFGVRGFWSRRLYGAEQLVASPGVRAAQRTDWGMVEDTPFSSPFLGWRKDRRDHIIV